MKLIYFANVRLPTEKAHGLQIMKNCEAFASQSFEVQLIIPMRRNPDFEKIDSFVYYDVKRNFEIKKLKTVDPWWFIYGPQGSYIKLQSLLFMFKSYFYLRKFALDELKSAIIYTREEYLLPLLQRFSFSVVWEAHNLPSNKSYYVKYWRKCKKIVAISKGLKDDLVGLGIDREKIVMAPDGVDLGKFSAIGGSASGGQIANNKLQIREELGLPVDKKIVMYTGNFFTWKGVYTLADASKYLPDDCWIVFIGGSPHELNEFKKYLLQHEIQPLPDRTVSVQREKIKLVEHVNHQMIPSYLATADVLILPNSAKSEISSKYTSPLKMFEYMAAGKPIVASYLHSLREILDDTTALFFTPDDPADLARKVKQILDDEALGRSLSRNALEKGKNYTWQKRAEEILNMI